MTDSLKKMHRNNYETWMPDFYRRNGFFFVDDGVGLERIGPPSKTFPQIPRDILQHIADTVTTLRQEGAELVSVERRDPEKETFHFGEHAGPIDMRDLTPCHTQLFRTVHTHNYYFKPNLREIALQVPPEIWGVARYVQCERLVDEAGDEQFWPPYYLVDPTTGHAMSVNRMHLANTTIYTVPSEIKTP